MKNLGFLFTLFVGILIVSCTNQKEELKANNLITTTDGTAEVRSEDGEDQVQIGILHDDGTFEFTVSEDELGAVFNYNTETNIGQPGTLENADVVPNENDEDPGYNLIMNGALEEGSASLYADVHDYFDEALGLVVIRINLKPVRAGLCWASWCNTCQQTVITNPGGDCRCIGGPDCPYYQDPTILWHY